MTSKRSNCNDRSWRRVRGYFPTHVAVKLRHGWGTRAVEVLERTANGKSNNNCNRVNGDRVARLVVEVEAEAGLYGPAALTGVEVVLVEVGGQEEGLAELGADAEVGG